VGQAKDLTIRVEFSKGLNLGRKYQTRMEVTDRDKHSSLQQCGINYSRKKLYRKGLWVEHIIIGSRWEAIRKITKGLRTKEILFQEKNI
jgi:hypothetical protein